MDMFNKTKEYVIGLRREIHMYPEVDFDLPVTVALVKRELETYGIPYTEEYGEGSVVGYINPEKAGFTIALRADMDALRMNEKVDTPYKSKREGFMHACGHDAHTAILLGVARVLKGMENQLACKVKLLFQPSEEGMRSGARMMVDNGVLDDVDIIFGQHVTNSLKSGVMGVCPGESQATSRHFKIEIVGRSAHAAQPHTGIDALAVAVRLYNDIQLVLNREIAPMERRLCSIGTLNAGTTHNVVAGGATMTGTIRTFSRSVSEYIWGRIEQIASSLSAETGATITTYGPLKSDSVYNNPYLSELVIESLKRANGEENVAPFPCMMSSEDFAHYARVIPGVFFRLGTGDAERGITASAHHNDFDISEDALISGVRAMVQLVLDYQGGVDMDRARLSDTREG
ncbi:MAG: amidohydrolase [Clostridia bacterium]|nr:amidohydrolase [Clostridia bacterium]